MNLFFPKMKAGRKLTYAALLLAMAIVSTAIFKLVPMGNLVFVRFSLTPSLIIFSSLFLGPFYGAAIGMLADLIPAFLVPTGLIEVNFLITLVYGLYGALPALFAFLIRRFPWLSSVYALPVLFLISMAALVPYLVIDPGLAGFFGTSSEWALPLVLTVVVLLNLGAFLYFLLSLRRGTSSLGRGILLIAYSTELLCGTYLKAGAFCLFLSFLSSSPSPVPFPFVLSMLAAALPINVMISNFFVNVYCSVMSKLGLLEGSDGNR